MVRMSSTAWVAMVVASSIAIGNGVVARARPSAVPAAVLAQACRLD